MLIVIINSTSGNTRNEKIITILNAKLHTPFVPYFTHEYQELEFWKRVKNKLHSHSDEIKGIVVIGGDGTFHHAVNHLHSFNLPFGLIPRGSGNDFAKALKIPNSLKTAIARINKKNHRKYDLIYANGTLINSVLSMGVDAETAIKARQSRLKVWMNRAFIGKLTYLALFFTIILRYKPFDITFSFPDGVTTNYKKVWLLAIGNTPYYGGGIPICPKADHSDGKLDIVLVHRFSVFHLLLALPTVFFRFHTHLSWVDSFQADQFNISSQEPVLIQGDGEKIGHTPLEVTIKKETISIY